MKDLVNGLLGLIVIPVGDLVRIVLTDLISIGTGGIFQTHLFQSTAILLPIFIVVAIPPPTGKLENL